MSACLCPENESLHHSCQSSWMAGVDALRCRRPTTFLVTIACDGQNAASNDASRLQQRSARRLAKLDDTCHHRLRRWLQLCRNARAHRPRHCDDSRLLSLVQRRHFTHDSPLFNFNRTQQSGIACMLRVASYCSMKALVTRLLRT